MIRTLGRLLALITAGAFAIFLLLYLTTALMSGTILGISFGISATAIIGLIIYELLPLRTYRGIKDYYAAEISKSPALQRIYEEALHKVGDCDLREAIKILDLPTIPIKSTFYRFYYELYQSLDGLAMLYVQKQCWLTGELQHSHDSEMLGCFDILNSADEEVLTATPWLISIGKECLSLQT